MAAGTKALAIVAQLRNSLTTLGSEAIKKSIVRIVTIRRTSAVSRMKPSVHQTEKLPFGQRVGQAGEICEVELFTTLLREDSGIGDRAVDPVPVDLKCE